MGWHSAAALTRWVYVVITALTRQWVYVVITTPLPHAHPVHLHGHDFFVLAQAEGPFGGQLPAESFANPPRRDVAHLPANGHLVLAWEADNAGVWLLHCVRPSRFWARGDAEFSRAWWLAYRLACLDGVFGAVYGGE